LCVGICSAVIADELKLTTTFDKRSFYRGEPVVAWLVAENNSKDTLIVSVMRGLAGASFEVVNEHGKALPYAGPMIQRAYGTVDDSQILRPGSRRAFSATLDSSHALRAAGSYTVTATVQVAATLRPVTDRWMPSQGMENLRTVRSEPQTITITDINDPAVMIMKDGGGGWLSSMNRYFVRGIGYPKPSPVELTKPSILDPYIAIVRMQFMERPRDLRQWRQSFMKRFPDFDQPGLLWMNMAEAADRYNLKGLDGLIEDAKRNPVMARHPALLVMERRKSLLLDEQKEATP
jgi:hypothetical protein